MVFRLLPCLGYGVRVKVKGWQMDYFYDQGLKGKGNRKLHKQENGMERN